MSRGASSDMSIAASYPRARLLTPTSNSTRDRRRRCCCCFCVSHGRSGEEVVVRNAVDFVNEDDAAIPASLLTTLRSAVATTPPLSPFGTHANAVPITMRSVFVMLLLRHRR